MEVEEECEEGRHKCIEDVEGWKSRYSRCVEGQFQRLEDSIMNLKIYLLMGPIITPLLKVLLIL